MNTDFESVAMKAIIIRVAASIIPQNQAHEKFLNGKFSFFFYLCVQSSSEHFNIITYNWVESFLIGREEHTIRNCMFWYNLSSIVISLCYANRNSVRFTLNWITKHQTLSLSLSLSSVQHPILFYLSPFFYLSLSLDITI